MNETHLRSGLFSGVTYWRIYSRILYSSSSSVFAAMLDLQFGEKGEVRSLPQCLHRSPKLPVGIHRTGPCLASQIVEGGAKLQDVVGV